MTDAAARLTWRTGRGVLHLERACVMGVLNVTPDSFYDGGRFSNEAAALRHAETMLAHGADVIDVGAESTRPGAEPVPADVELARLIPILRSLVKELPHALISVDTVKSGVARAAADEGAAIINDVSGLRLDAAIADSVAAHGLGLILMHSRGEVGEMARYEQAVYGDDVVGDIVRELAGAVTSAKARGVGDEQLMLDPGVGFSKRGEHSFAVLAQLDRVCALGYPVAIGPSRKRFTGEDLAPQDRLDGTLGAVVAARAKGAALFRVHDVGPARRALDVADRILNP